MLSICIYFWLYCASILYHNAYHKQQMYYIYCTACDRALLGPSVDFTVVDEFILNYELW